MGQSKARGDFIGRLTRDAELTYTSGGMALCKFSIVTDDRVKKGDQWVDEPSFWNCTLWGKQAESLNQYLTKGKLVGLDGSLRVESWDKDGQKHNKVSVNVSSIVLLGGSQSGSSGNQSTNAGKRDSANPSAIGSDFTDDLPDGEIPF